MMNLIELVEAGDVQGVLGALRELTAEQRAAQAAPLEAHFEPGLGNKWVIPSPQWQALAAARMGSRPRPRDAVDWLVNADYLTLTCGWMVDITNLYSTEWRAELVACIAAQSWWGSLHNGLLFELAEHIILDTGCPLPTSDEFIRQWLMNRAERRWRPGRPDHVLGGPRDGNLLARLRNDPFTPTLLPLAVASPKVGVSAYRKDLVAFAAKGVIDRDMLIRRTFLDLTRRTPAVQVAEKLLAGEPLSPSEQDLVARTRAELAGSLISDVLRGSPRPLTDLQALALTPAENAPLLRDHVAMLDRSSLIAAYGQEVLLDLDGAGLLEADVLTEICERVLLRPEKKLVGAQLAWLNRVAKRDATRTGRILTDAALTFQHSDVGLQERALNLVARHLPAVTDEQVLSDLREAAASLNPGLTTRATELLGPPGQDATGPSAGPSDELLRDILPEMPEPAPVRPIDTAAEVAPEVAVLLADRENVVAFERALDGLVRHARLDRGTLSKALEPVMRRKRDLPGSRWSWTPLDTQLDVYDVAAAVRGDEPRTWHVRLRHEDPDLRAFWAAMAIPPTDMLKARLTEAIELIESDAQPYLLALPTHANGAVDAATLVERITEFESLGITPAPIDLAQALLRVTPTDDERVRDAADALRSNAGRRLARWLDQGGAPHRDTTPEKWPADNPIGAEPGRWAPADPCTDHDLPLPPVAAALLGPSGPYTSAGGAFWFAQLPHHRDEMAARLANTRSPQVATPATIPSPRLLPRLMEMHGTAGYATHWQIARRLDGNAKEEDAVVDALLVLAAQGQLDARLFAGQWQALLRTPARATAVLRAAAETGAWATVWSILEAALPALLRDKAVNGAGAILALAVECAARSGAKGSIPEVDEMAMRKGSSQTMKNARLLRDVLRS
ncbi:DUF7824 domain-containing protein [Streptomyces lienomycini]|uniref:DUF6493 family protein n=1 Tax=Streptomyces lienomycini TaxID=284035 RepID=A0ABV9X701_9ACTN|nr:DUF6493 family protein [Streptomyces lienomycini]